MLAFTIIALKAMHADLCRMTMPQLLKHRPTIRIEGLNGGMREDGLLH
jgi:hypothetical protein